jgi:hypothetical protein
LARVAHLSARVGQNWLVGEQALSMIWQLLMSVDCKRLERSADLAANEGKEKKRVLSAKRDSQHESNGISRY